MSQQAYPPFSFASFSNSIPANIKKWQPTYSDVSIYSKTKYRTKPGMMLRGQCVNQECTNKNALIWAALGLKSYDMAYKIHNTPCPDCGKNLINVSMAAIYNCLLVGRGQKVTNTDQEIFQHKIFQNDSYILFGQLPTEMVQWKYLTLKSTLPKMCPQKHKLGDYQKCYTDWICKNCKEEFEGNQKSKYCTYCRYHLCWDCM